LEDGFNAIQVSSRYLPLFQDAPQNRQAFHLLGNTGWNRKSFSHIAIERCTPDAEQVSNPRGFIRAKFTGWPLREQAKRIDALAQFFSGYG
jgi:hypothetical protein